MGCSRVLARHAPALGSPAAEKQKSKPAIPATVPKGKKQKEAGKTHKAAVSLVRDTSCVAIWITHLEGRSYPLPHPQLLPNPRSGFRSLWYSWGWGDWWGGTATTLDTKQNKPQKRYGIRTPSPRQSATPKRCSPFLEYLGAHISPAWNLKGKAFDPVLISLRQVADLEFFFYDSSRPNKSLSFVLLVFPFFSFSFLPFYLFLCFWLMSSPAKKIVSSLIFLL